MKARTLYEKISDRHVVAPTSDDEVLLYIDRHLVNEVTSPQAFERLRAAGRRVRFSAAAIAVADHNVPTTARASGLSGIIDAASRLQVETLERNAREFEIPYVPLTSQVRGSSM